VPVLAIERAGRHLLELGRTHDAHDPEILDLVVAIL